MLRTELVVPHRLPIQLMRGLYIKWALSPNRLVFWDEFSHLICDIWYQSQPRSGGPRSGIPQSGSLEEPVTSVVTNVAVTNEDVGP
jgi:hypothetical protein